MGTIDPDTVAAAVSGHLGRPVRVEGLRRLSGGASRETWAFDAVAGDGGDREPLVLRRDPGAHVGETDRATEFDVLAAVHGAGIPVPRVRFLLEPGDRLGAGFVMDHLDGETIPRRILRDEAYRTARRGLARACGEVAARIHAVDGPALAALTYQDAGEQIDRYRSVLDALDEPHPAFELALRRLAEHRPGPPAHPRLVHGDFRNGNLVVGPDGLRGVLDWELAHLGDPVEDLAWMCVRSWRFGHTDAVVGGFGDLDDLLDGYVAGGGTRPDDTSFRAWLVLGTLKWGIICMMQAAAHRHGLARSVELAVLGRRVAETEWDLLELLDGGW